MAEAAAAEARLSANLLISAALMDLRRSCSRARVCRREEVSVVGRLDGGCGGRMGLGREGYDGIG